MIREARVAVWKVVDELKREIEVLASGGELVVQDHGERWAIEAFKRAEVGRRVRWAAGKPKNLGWVCHTIMGSWKPYHALFASFACELGSCSCLLSC